MGFRSLLVGLSTAVLIVGTVLSVLVHGPNPMLHPDPYWRLPFWTRELLSAGVGVAFGGAVIVLTRVAVRRTRWARQLHRDLRPLAQQMSPALIVVIAILSSSGEEMLFRSLLTPLIGVVPQAIVFGLLHQIPGPSRWVWVSWAAAAGLAFGAMYQLIGSLTGPMLAHGLINGVNLMVLRSHDADSL